MFLILCLEIDISLGLSTLFVCLSDFLNVRLDGELCTSSILVPAVIIKPTRRRERVIGDLVIIETEGLDVEIFEREV